MAEMNGKIKVEVDKEQIEEIKAFNNNSISFRDQIAIEYMKYEINQTNVYSLHPAKTVEEKELEYKKSIAKESYQMADSMMEERGRKDKTLIPDPFDIKTFNEWLTACGEGKKD